MVSFAEPDRLLLLLLPAASVVLAVGRHRVRLRQQRSLASPAVWGRLLGGVPATGLVRMLLWCAAAAALVLALARPQWGMQPVEESVETRDLVVALDVSDSMRCPDVTPSRLDRSLQILRRALPALAGNRIGVVVFAGDAYPLIPLTTDLDAAAMFLDTVEPGMVALPGSNIERAAAAALELLPEEGEARVVVLVTDGENLQGDPRAAAERLHRAGVGVLALVAGTEAGGPIPMTGEEGAVRYKRDREGRPVVTHAQPEVLAGLAESAGGDVLRLGEASERDLVARVAQLRTREIEARQRERRVDRFPAMLAAAGLLLVTAFLVSPWRRMAVVSLLVSIFVAGSTWAQSPAAAGAPRAPAASVTRSADTEPAIAWWQRWLPGGARRLAREGVAEWRRGEAREAAGVFGGALQLDPDDPERAFDYGTALAASGDLEAAIAQLDRSAAGGVTGAAYNAGTAALAQGQAEVAVEKLREALLANPGLPQVKRNYELALQMLEEQQQQQQQQQQDSEQQQQEQQPEPTPTPAPDSEPQSGPPPTPTPDPNGGLYAALERAEEEAREALQSPTPQPGQVEKDW